MDYQQFINQEIVNSLSQKGVVTKFNDEYVVVKYQDKELTYSKSIAFKNQHLNFVRSELNELIKKDLLEIEEVNTQRVNEFEKNKRIAISRNKRVMNIYKKLSKKNRELKYLFGKDFEYPPYKALVKKYRYLLHSRVA